MPLVEVVAAEDAKPAEVEAAVAFYRFLGKKPVVLRRAVPGFVANRLQSALLRESIHLVREGVVTVGELDEIVTASIGSRWAVAGPFRAFHLGGGHGGLRHLMEHLGQGLERSWAGLGNPPVDEFTVETMLSQADEAFGPYAYEPLAAWRDRAQNAVIAAVEAAARRWRLTERQSGRGRNGGGRGREVPGHPVRMTGPLVEEFLILRHLTPVCAEFAVLADQDVPHHAAGRDDRLGLTRAGGHDERVELGVHAAVRLLAHVQHVEPVPALDGCRLEAPLVVLAHLPRDARVPACRGNAGGVGEHAVLGEGAGERLRPDGVEEVRLAGVEQLDLGVEPGVGVVGGRCRRCGVGAVYCGVHDASSNDGARSGALNAAMWSWAQVRKDRGADPVISRTLATTGSWRSIK